MSTRRAVITGLGILAPNGNGKKEYWDALINGRSGIKRITHFDPSPFNTQIAGEVKNFDPCEYFDPKFVKRSGRFTHFGVATSKMAVADAGVDLSKERKYRCGVCFGTTIGAENDIYERQHKRFIEYGPNMVDRFTSTEFTPHVTTSYICSELKISGSNSTVTSGCSTGLDVVNWGYNMIKGGNLDIAVVGSADAPVFPFAMATFCALGILSKRNAEPERASRPYDKDRDGMVISEGGASVVIEELSHALDRDANIYGEVLAYSSSSEISDDIRRVDMSGVGLVAALEQALVAGRTVHDEIDYICSHGNAIASYDVAETNAFKTFFGKRVYKIPISSIKSMTGQALAASGVFQVVATSLCMQKGFITPTINLDTPDHFCDLDYVPNRGRRFYMDTALINSHSVGGTHAVLVLRRYS